MLADTTSTVEVSLTVRGNLDQVAEMMRRVFGVSQDEQGQDKIIDNDDETPLPEVWSREDLARLWAEIYNRDARRLLAEMATKPAPNGYPVSSLGPAIGIGANMVGGKLSSIGFARKRVFPGKKDFRIVDNATWRFMLDPQIAAIIRDLAKAEGL